METIENNNLEVKTTNKGGAPLGNNNARKNKLFYDMIKRRLTQKPEELEKIVDILIVHATKGESWAVKEIMDRVDGKAIQATEISGVDGADLSSLQTINIVLKKPDGS